MHQLFDADGRHVIWLQHQLERVLEHGLDVGCHWHRLKSLVQKRQLDFQAFSAFHSGLVDEGFSAFQLEFQVFPFSQIIH